MGNKAIKVDFSAKSLAAPLRPFFEEAKKAGGPSKAELLKIFSAEAPGVLSVELLEDKAVLAFQKAILDLAASSSQAQKDLNSIEGLRLDTSPEGKAIAASFDRLFTNLAKGLLPRARLETTVLLAIRYKADTRGDPFNKHKV